LFCTRIRIDGVPPRAARMTGSEPVPGGSEPAAGGSEPATGEILVAGPTVAPAARARDGWLHTGDLGALDEHGFLTVTGRVADTIVSGGENVAPAEVEAALESHPGVLEAAVLGRPDPRWGEAVCALVRARADTAVAVTALRAHCAARLAAYKVPKQIELINDPLPRTASGKLLRRELS
jgi:acyl-CoA synthetase (AMP-forming)/AMP-acid ligase II